MNEVLYSNKSAAFIDESIKAVTLPIISTYGPKGTSVLIQQNDKPLLTKDGLTVCKHLFPNSQNPIISNIRNTLIDMEKKAGDGTTTTACLIKAFWAFFNNNRKEILKHYSPYTFCEQLFPYIEYAYDTIVYELSQEYDSTLVATVSNNDADIIQLFDTYPEINNKGIIHTYQSKSGSGIIYSSSKGEYFPNEFLSLSYPLLPESGSITIHNPTVYLQDKFSIQTLGNHSSSKGDNIVIITNSELTELDIQNLKSNSDYRVVIFYSPAIYRSKLATILNMSAYDMISKEYVESIEIDRKFGVFINTEKSDTLHHKVVVCETNELIYEERIHRIEDCIKAISSSKRGICKGAGLTYVEIANKLKAMVEQEREKSNNPNYHNYPAEILIYALNFPNQVIQKSTRLNNEELEKLNIKDSTDVVTTALLYAFEAVKPLFLTNYIILNTYTN